MFSHLALAFERHFNRIVSPPSAFRSWSWVQGNSQEGRIPLCCFLPTMKMMYNTCGVYPFCMQFHTQLPGLGKKKLGHPKNLAWATSLSQSAKLRVNEALVITQLRFLVSCKLCKSCAFFSWHIYIKFDSSCASLSILELWLYMNISYSSFILPWGIYP